MKKLPVIFALSFLSLSTQAWTSTAERAVTPIGEVKRGSMVAVEGTVKRILDTDEFRLGDTTGSIRIDVGYPNFVPVAEGERVRVDGFVDRDLFREIYAQRIVHEDGRITQLDRRGY